MEKNGAMRDFEQIRNKAKKQFSFAVASLGFEDTVIKAMIDWQNKLERKTDVKANEFCSAYSERPKK